ncbi:SprT-like domain-containing protein, partial [Pedobacter psychrotolerans]
PGGGGTPYFDCAGVKNGKAIESPCGCIGGTTGLESCGQKVDIDPEARQCLKDIKAKLEVLGMKNTALSTGLISEVLNSLNLSKGSNFNAIINEAVLSKGIVAETTLITNPNSWGSQGYVSKITFNTSVLNTATDLKLVATMMHEYIHAYFDWNMYLIRTGQKNHDSDFEKNYKILFDESGDPLPDSFGNTAQHEQIAKSFVSNISAMLKSYAISESIPFPADPNYFEKMGWVGLQKTKAGTFAPNGTWYTTNAESGTSSPTITQTIKCKKL